MCMIYFHIEKPTSEDFVYCATHMINRSVKARWLEDPLVQQYLADIDNIDQITGRYLHSAVYDSDLSPRELSDGSKHLLALQFLPEYIYSTCFLGDNCARWVVEISRLHDIHLWYNYHLKFPCKFEGRIVETGQDVTETLEVMTAKALYFWEEERKHYDPYK